MATYLSHVPDILIQFIILQIIHACEEYSHSVLKDKLKLQYFILNACLIAAKDKDQSYPKLLFLSLCRI